MAAGEQKIELTSTAHLAPKKRKDRFLKGPVPMLWLETASSLGGKCLHVGIVLWHLKGMAKEDAIKLTKGACERMGISATSVRLALERLEEAELIAVDRGPGRCPRVTVLEPKDSAAGAAAIESACAIID